MIPVGALYTASVFNFNRDYIVWTKQRIPVGNIRMVNKLNTGYTQHPPLGIQKGNNTEYAVACWVELYIQWSAYI